MICDTQRSPIEKPETSRNSNSTEISPEGLNLTAQWKDFLTLEYSIHEKFSLSGDQENIKLTAVSIEHGSHTFVSDVYNI